MMRSVSLSDHMDSRANRRPQESDLHFCERILAISSQLTQARTPPIVEFLRFRAATQPVISILLAPMPSNTA